MFMKMQAVHLVSKTESLFRLSPQEDIMILAIRDIIWGLTVTAIWVICQY